MAPASFFDLIYRSVRCAVILFIHAFQWCSSFLQLEGLITRVSREAEVQKDWLDLHSLLFHLHQLDELKDHSLSPQWFILSPSHSSWWSPLQFAYASRFASINRQVDATTVYTASLIQLNFTLNHFTWLRNVEIHSQMHFFFFFFFFFPLRSISTHLTLLLYLERLFHCRLISPSTGSYSTRLKCTERRKTKMKSWSNKMSNKLTKWVCLCMCHRCCCCRLIHSCTCIQWKCCSSVLN